MSFLMDGFVGFDKIDEHLKIGDYPTLGEGSGRKVFDLGNDTVVKVAINVKGYAQNEVECMISGMDESDTFAKVLHATRDGRCLVMKKAGPIHNFAVIRSYYHVENNKDLFRLNNLKYIPRKYNLLVSDLCRPDNWGVIDGRPVIIDYGFTGQIRRKYY